MYRSNKCMTLKTTLKLYKKSEQPRVSASVLNTAHIMYEKNTHKTLPNSTTTLWCH